MHFWLPLTRQKLCLALQSLTADAWLVCVVQLEKPALNRIMAELEQGKPARSVPLSDPERMAVKGLQLLTMKPLIYAVNVTEGDLANAGADNKHVTAMRTRAGEEHCEVVVVSAQVPVCCFSGMSACMSLARCITAQSVLVDLAKSLCVSPIAAAKVVLVKVLSMQGNHCKTAHFKRTQHGASASPTMT